MCMGSSGTVVLSHTGQVLKREATPGHPAPLPPAVVKVGPLIPSGAPKRDMTLASDLVPSPSLEAASLPAWPSPKHIPGPGLGEEGPGSGPGLRLASGSPVQAPVLDSNHSLEAGGPRPAFSSWAPPVAWLTHYYTFFSSFVE